MVLGHLCCMAAGIIAERMNLSPSNVSFHLKELDRAGLISQRRESRSIVYTAGYDTLAGLVKFLMDDCCAIRPSEAPSSNGTDAARLWKTAVRMALVRSGHAGIVSALGITQIIGYGTLYYSFSILAPQIAADLSISLEQVFAVFSLSLFVGGLSATVIGRQRNITYLTLIGGFASTIFWPISAALLDVLTWREIYVLFAALNLLLCMPLHFWIMSQGKAIRVQGVQQAREHVVGAIPFEKRRKAMLIVSAAFAILGFTLASILAHMVPMLGTLGLGTAAVVIGALFSPAQVASRLINMVFGSRLSPPMLAVISAALMVGGIVILGITGSSLAGALAFAICLGPGSGINSIAQGSLPLYLFGSEGYGAVTGKMAAARLAAGAAAPFGFAAAKELFKSGTLEPEKVREIMDAIGQNKKAAA